MSSKEAIKCGQEIDKDLERMGLEESGKSRTFIKMAIEALKERENGKWFDTANVYDKRANKHDYFCLECKTHAMDFICGSEDWWCGKAPKYCPNCGAKMEGE